MKRNRGIAAFVVAVVAAGGLAACCADSSSSDGSVTISIMEFQQTRIDSIKKVLPGFEAAMKKQGKDIKVKLVADVLTDDQFKTKVI